MSLKWVVLAVLGLLCVVAIAEARNYCGGIVSIITPALTSVSAICPSPIIINGTSTCSATANYSGGSMQTVTGSATWTSSNTAVATMSANVATGVAAGSATITATYAGLQGQSTLQVNSTGGGAFPHLSNTGQILTTYTSGSSVWLRSMFDGSFGSAPTADFQSAGINSWEDGNFRPYPPNDLPNLSTSWTCGSGPWNSTVQSCAHTWWLNNKWNGLVSEYQSSGMTVFAMGDNVNAGFFNPSFPQYQFLQPWNQDISSSLFTLGSPLKLIVAQVMQDEFPNSSDPNSASPCGFGNTIESFNMGFTGIPNDPICPSGVFTPGGGLSASITTRVATGAELATTTVTSSSNLWYGNSTVTDLAIVEMGGEASPESGLTTQLNGDARLATAFPVRGVAFPAVSSAVTCDGPAYSKRTNDTQFTPGVDSFFQAGTVPGNVVDEEMGALAHGYAGVRTYSVDSNWVGNRATDPVGGSNIEQTGCSPLSGWTNGVGGHPEIGQDRWYAMSAANNVLKALESFGLLDSPQMTPPPGCNAFYNYTQTNTSSPIACGARQASAARVVVFINWSSNGNSISYDPAPYVYAGGTAASWKINSVPGQHYVGTFSATGADCGTQVTNPASTDCGFGPTTVTGATTVNPWELGATGQPNANVGLPAAGAAPTTATTLTMQPTEVDVFLYHP